MLARKSTPATTTLRTTPSTNLSDYMDRLFDNFRDEMMSGFFPRATLWGGNLTGRWLPALMDVEDKGPNYEVRTDLPGAKKENIEVKVLGHTLQISAEESAGASEEGTNYLCHERTYQGFQRSVELPEDVVPEKISAQYRDGVLSVSIPKAHPVPERRVPVG